MPARSKERESRWNGFLAESEYLYERQGFTVDIANTGLEGEEKASITDYDAVLLDLNLPDRDGLDILAFLRNSGRNMPVLIVSAREAVKERAAGLDLGGR